VYSYVIKQLLLPSIAMIMTSTFALQFLGLLLLVVSLAGIARTQHLVKATDELSHSHMGVYLMSVLRVMIGLTFALQPTLWGAGLDSLPGFLGLLVLAAGVFGLVFPDETMKMLPMWSKSPQRLRAWMFVPFVAGAALTMMGFGIV
jgi:hypothetical protein